MFPALTLTIQKHALETNQTDLTFRHKKKLFQGTVPEPVCKHSKQLRARSCLKALVKALVRLTQKNYARVVVAKYDPFLAPKQEKELRARSCWACALELPQNDPVLTSFGVTEPVSAQNTHSEPVF